MAQALGWPDRKWKEWRRQEWTLDDGEGLAPCARMKMALTARNRKWMTLTRKMAPPRRWAH